MARTDTLITRVNTYCDTAPRATAEAEQLGPFTLFVARTGWPFYARPTLDIEPGPSFTPSDFDAVLGRQRALGIPLTFEWVHESAPALLAAAQEHGLSIERRPLLVLDQPIDPVVVEGVTVMMIDPDDDRIVDARAAVSAGFEDRDDLRPERVADTIRQRAREGLIAICGAFATDGSAVGGGTNAQRDDACELTGIAVLPKNRGRGIGAALTAALAEDARARGADLIWLSATDDSVARVYERVGFTRVGTTCEAEAD